MGFFETMFGDRGHTNPESEFTVTITDDFVKVEYPGRNPESVYWSDIREVRLINTDEGPFKPDVWLYLVGDKGGCVVPQGCEGYDKLYDIVSQYNGFDFDNVIKSMSCSSNEEFLLWTRDKQ